MKRKKRTIRAMVSEATPKISKHQVDEIGDRVWQRLKAKMDGMKDQLALRSLYGDGWNAPPLEEGDFQILSAVRLLAGKGTDIDILNTVEKRTGQTVLVRPRLERLEAEGLLTASGAGERRFQVTELGERALGRAKAEGKSFAQAQEAVAEEKASEDLIEGHEAL
jgi:DNA-binding PadR family transcriptional regulator